MAKFRRGHQRTRYSGMRISGMLVAVAIILLLFLLSQWTGEKPSETPVVAGDSLSAYFPHFPPGEVVRHTYYTLSYNEETEQAQWVIYELTRNTLRQKNVPRTNWYYTDDMVPTGSAEYNDYSHSGYNRGHLAPAADMAFDTLAMHESFYMSNMSPQVRAFNNGIWRELEEQTRDWAISDGRLIIVTGPVFGKEAMRYIGKDRVAVPVAFYKILLDPDQSEVKSIAFVIPNALSDQPLMDYAVTIDSVEVLTGIDFFPEIPQTIDESRMDPSKWRVDGKRYDRRLREWNYQ